MPKLTTDTLNETLIEIDVQDESPLQSHPKDTAFMVRLSLDYAFLYARLAVFYEGGAPLLPCRQSALSLAARSLRLLAFIDATLDKTDEGATLDNPNTP